MKIYIFLFLSLFFPLGFLMGENDQGSQKLITFSRRILLKEFPNACNPSIIKTEYGILLSFRVPRSFHEFWINEIGVVLLNDSFEPISSPQLLWIRSTEVYPPYYQDCRLFRYNGKLYILYGDCNDFNFPAHLNPFATSKEYMNIAELKYENGKFTVVNPIKLTYLQKLNHQQREKNWVPFEWNGKLLLSYYPSPHEIMEADLSSGLCQHLCTTTPRIAWNWGTIRGGTPATLVNGEYLTFFHSSLRMKSKASGTTKPHYFMGAYTFSSQPPFAITRISALPITAKGMYTRTDYAALVIFPCGYFVQGENVYVSYGRNDREVWVAEISLQKLLSSLKITGKYH